LPLRIEDYGLIGDCETAALVGRDGSIDWLCWPAFDSDACFAAILGTPRNGRWLITPAAEIKRSSRRYWDNTLILETRLETADGTVALIDFMPPRGKASDVVRLVRGIKGRVKMRMQLVIRFGFGTDIPWVKRTEDRSALLAIAGQAAFLLPWIWAPLVWCGFLALRRGPRDPERWLLVCLAAPPILLFTVAALWGIALFHWAAPGYLMLLPLLGEAIARRRQSRRLVRVWLGATAAFVVIGVIFVIAEIRYNWFVSLPNRDLVGWTSLQTELADRGFLDRPGLVVATLKWHEAGKVDYALGGRLPVICLGPDPRQYGLVANPDGYAGSDVLIVAPRRSFEQITGQFGPLFDSIEPIAPATVMHAGRPAMELALYLGHRLHKSAGRDANGAPRNSP